MQKIKFVPKVALAKVFQKQDVNSVFAQLKIGESYTSLILGVIVVVLGAFLLLSFIKTMNLNRSVAPASTLSNEIKPSVQKKDAAKTYVVAVGDNLWSIAEKQYKSGYNWVEIARANKLSNPDVLAVGTKLTLPVIQTKEIALTQTVETGEPASVSSVQKITADTYTVAAGDLLWDIAVRAYGDGYKWVDIARANNLSDPNLIFSGNVLKLPR